MTQIFDESGNITAVSITNSTYYPETEQFTQLEIINDRLIALDPGTNINDWNSIASSSQAINLWSYVESISEGVSVPASYTAANTNNWANPAPTTLVDAIDRIAAWIKTQDPTGA